MCWRREEGWPEASTNSTEPEYLANWQPGRRKSNKMSVACAIIYPAGKLGVDKASEGARPKLTILEGTT
jgi:hypothetical protein